MHTQHQFDQMLYKWKIVYLTRVRQDVVYRSIVDLHALLVLDWRPTFTLKLQAICFLVDLPDDRLGAVAMVQVDIKYDDAIDPMLQMR